MFSKEKVKVFFEFDSFFGFDAGIEEQLKQNDFFLIFDDLFHLDNSFIKCVDESEERVKLFRAIKDTIGRRF